MDLSKFTTEDLQAFQGGDLTKVSTAGLQMMADLHHQERVSAQEAKDRETYSPTKGQGFLENVQQGIGRGMASVGRAVGLGSTTKEEAAQIDAPLMKTAGGKVGNVVGNAAIAAPLAFVPGANTALGAAALGGAYGAATTEGGLADRAEGAAFGAGGGALGVGLGKGFGYAAGKIKDSRAAAQVANAGKDAAAIEAKQAGYVLPPTEVNPSFLNSALEGLSGKIKTSQAASARNQGVTNALAKTEIGAAADQPLSMGALNAIRAKAGQAYDAVANTGHFQPPPAYDATLDKIVAPYLKAAQSFPGAKVNPIVTEIESLRTPLMDSASAVSKIKELRGAADTAYAQGNKELGKALKGGADAIEGAIDSHLVASGAPADLLKNFRDARQLIAKTYSVQKAMNVKTGDVSAGNLANQLARGKPLSGDLKTIAETGSAFPKATQTLQQNYNATSPLDYMAAFGGSAVTGNPLMMLTAGARPLVRNALLSRPGQALAGKPNYGGNALLELLAENRALPIAGMVAPRK